MLASSDGPKNPLGKYIGDLHTFLGVEIDANTASEGVLKALLRRLSRFDRRAIWQRYTTRRAVMCCGYPAREAKVVVVNNNGVRHYRGIERCKSAWICVVCGAIIRNYRSQEIKKGTLYGMNELKWYAYMVTRTMQHDINNSLDYLIKLQAKCKRRVDGQPALQRFYDEYGFEGAILAKEVTHSDRFGHHPHTHELMFFREVLGDKGEIKLYKMLYKHTNNFYIQNGHEGISESKGIHIQRVTKNAGNLGEYLQKLDGGFNANDELTRLDLKRGRQGSRSIFQILEDFCNNPNEKDYNLLIEYEDATAGMHILHWKQGLRAKLLPKEPELTDEQLLEIEIKGKEEALFENWYFKQIKNKNLDGILLGALQLGGVDAMIDVLIRYGMYDENGLTILDQDEQDIKTAFDVKCENEIKKYSDEIVLQRDKKIASDQMYLNYLRKEHWMHKVDNS